MKSAANVSRLLSRAKKAGKAKSSQQNQLSSQDLLTDPIASSCGAKRGVRLYGKIPHMYIDARPDRSYADHAVDLVDDSIRGLGAVEKAGKQH